MKIEIVMDNEGDWVRPLINIINKHLKADKVILTHKGKEQSITVKAYRDNIRNDALIADILLTDKSYDIIKDIIIELNKSLIL